MTELERIKNEVAQERKYANWETILCDLRRCNIYEDFVIELENKAMQRYAELRCKEQREICFSVIPLGSIYREYYLETQNAVYTAPLATYKTT